MINSDILTPLLLSAFNREITWLDLSTRYPLDEFIDTFYRTRERTRANLEGLTDEQVTFTSPVHPFWSISESMLVAPRIPPAANTPQLDPKHSPIPVALPASTQQPPQRPRKLRMALVFAGSAAVGLLVSWAAGIF